MKAGDMYEVGPEEAAITTARVAFTNYFSGLFHGMLLGMAIMGMVVAVAFA